MEKLESFYNFLNSLIPDLKFTIEIGNNLKISIINGQLETTVYSKPTDFHLYLHAKSYHKASCFRGIQKGVALRLPRICSTDNEYSSKSIEYQDYLNRRGHDPKKIEILLKKLIKSLKMKQGKRRLITAVTTTELFFRQNLILDYQMSPK